MVKKENIHIFDLVELVHYVHPNTEYIAKAIKLYDIRNNREYFFIVECKDSFYLGDWKNINILKIVRKISATDREKKLMLQKAIYIKKFDNLNSRWHKGDREILSSVWRRINKRKGNILYRVSKEFIEERNKKRGYDSGHKPEHLADFVGLWIIHYTKYKQLTIDGVIGVYGLEAYIKNRESNEKLYIKN